LKIRIPFSYLLIIIVLVVIALFVLGGTLGWYQIDTIFFFVMGAIIGWIGLIALALIGAFFLGMLMSHRILSIGDFTPFEREMIKMREEIKEILERIEKLSGPTGSNDQEPDRSKDGGSV